MTVIKRSFGSTLYEATCLVSQKDHGMRLDQFAHKYLPGLSREQIKKKIDHGEIQVTGRPVKARPKTRVQTGDKISLKIHNTNHEDEWWNGKKLNLETAPTIVYEDDQLIGVSKPPYMSVHPTGKHLFNCVTVYFEHSCQQNVYSVHRLDRETSGILILAKNVPAASMLTHFFENNLIKKCYFFISLVNEQYNEEGEFSVQDRIDRCERFGLKRVVMNIFPPDSAYGKEALTHFKILERKNHYALGLAFPKTGRQHQIRVHAMARGIPLLGDKIYCGSFEMFQRFKDNEATQADHCAMEISRHALHSLAINFPHPQSPHQRKTLLSPLPQDLRQWLSIKTGINPEYLQVRLKEEVENYFNMADK